ncbi:hypothetical protein [Streptomyces sp. NBC_00963]|uniref:hypothetical protein n=1 Tax=Streptomyces sp. NBC_00963 TaxID=2903697 RepID=UPI0038646823
MPTSAVLIGHDHIHRRVVDLDLLQQPGDRRRHTPGGTPPADRSGRAASRSSRAVVDTTGSNCAIRRDTVPLEGTRRPRIRHSRAISWQTPPCQVPVAQHLINNRLDLIRQPPAAAAPAGAPRQQIRRHSLARPPPPE